MDVTKIKKMVTGSFLSIVCEGPSIGQLANIICNAELGVDEVRAGLNVKDCNLTVIGKEVWECHQADLINLMSDVLEFYSLHIFEIEVDGNSPLSDAFFEFSEIYVGYRYIVSPNLIDSLEYKKWIIDGDFIVDILDESMSIPVIRFEVNTPSDFIEIGRFCSEYEIPRYAVWVQPMQLYRDSEGNLEKKNEWIYLHCLQNNYNYYPKL